MKKLKIKLEYTFEVPDDTKIICDDWDGLFIENEKFGLKSKPDIHGLSIEYRKFDKKGNIMQSSLGYDKCSLDDFLYNNPETLGMLREKTTIHLGSEKFQHII